MLATVDMMTSLVEVATVNLAGVSQLHDALTDSGVARSPSKKRTTGFSRLKGVGGVPLGGLACSVTFA